MKSMLKSLMSVAAAALAFTSCSNDATEDVMPNGGSKTLVVNASIEQTRTVMAANHIDLEWAADDQIHLYIGDEATEAQAIHHTIVDKTTGVDKITNVDYQDGNTVYAYYSTGSDKSQGVKKVRLNIPAGQNQTKADVFAGENLPMAAKGQIQNGSVTLEFKPLGHVLVFNVYGPAQNEKIESIEFTAAGCSGYDSNGCNLTADPVKYTAYSDSKSAKVTLGTPAPIVASKPEGTQKGSGNQVYLVVAPVNYTAATITVTTNAGSYTFETKNGIDCSQSTARVVNLNLAKATTGFSPKISVPNSVPEQSSEANENLLIEGIVFKNISTDQISAAEVGVYSNEALTEQNNVSWLTVNNTTELAKNGSLYCNLAANESTESRTAYIGIQCKEANGTVVAQVAIPVTQVGAGSTPTVNAVATYTPSDATYGYNRGDVVSNVSLNNGDVTLLFAQGDNAQYLPKYYDSVVRCYTNNTITVSGSEILGIEIVREQNADHTRTLSANVGTMSGDTWTGKSDNVVLTVSDADGKGHIRIAKMIITYVESKEPKIIVPEVDQQSAAGGDLTIKDIVLKNIDVANVSTGVYSDAELANPLTSSWLTIKGSDLANGTLSCTVAANEATEPRTVYIGIKGGDVQAAIAVTQIGAADPGILFKEDFNTLTGTSEWKNWSPKFSAATKVYEAGGAIKLGSSDNPGSITTQKLDLSAPVTLEFKVKGWTKVEGHIIILVDGKEKGTFTYSAKNADAFEQASVKLAAATKESTITIATSAKRAYIDDIVVKVTEQ